MRVVVAFGSNLGRRRDAILKAAEEVSRLLGQSFTPSRGGIREGAAKPAHDHAIQPA